MFRIRPHRFRGVFTDGRGIYTQNLTPGTTFYDERTLKQDGIEYRKWEPFRSKLSAFIQKGCKTFPFREKSRVLYLGAASGTTASHISDIATGGEIYCLEISKIPFQKLLFLAGKRQNIIPLLADASFPDTYGSVIPQVDVIYQDISQRDQVELFLKNIGYLRKGGFGILMVKARSINVAVEPRKIFSAVETSLKQHGLKVIEKVELSPYIKDHAAIAVQKNP